MVNRKRVPVGPTTQCRFFYLLNEDPLFDIWGSPPGCSVRERVGFGWWIEETGSYDGWWVMWKYGTTYSTREEAEDVAARLSAAQNLDRCDGKNCSLRNRAKGEPRTVFNTCFR